MTREEITDTAIELTCKVQDGKPIVEDVQKLHDRIWQEAKKYYFTILASKGCKQK